MSVSVSAGGKRRVDKVEVGSDGVKCCGVEGVDPQASGTQLECLGTTEQGKGYSTLY
jgi:hypothetical protein